MLLKLYKISEVHFRLLDTNDFHVKAKNERFTAVSSHCRENLKYESFRSSVRTISELKHATFLSHGRQPEVCCFPI